MQKQRQRRHTPQKGLYDPTQQHDACGVGFVARLDAKPLHSVVEEAVSALSRMQHRGGAACAGEADGAGIMFPLPKDFMNMVWESHVGSLPEYYAIGHFFLSQDDSLRQEIETKIIDVLATHGLIVKGWRDTPVRTENVSGKALAVMPKIRQLLVFPENSSIFADAEEFERKLYIARKHLENTILKETQYTPEDFHIASFSSRSIVYKAMLSGGMLADFYPDLTNRLFMAHFAIFHERFSTNTQPAWRLAQPFHCLAHNGEINTLKCNQANMRMREPILKSPIFGSNNKHIQQVLDPNGSDSAMLDNTFELLVRAGRSIPHAAMMLLPEPFGDRFVMGEDKRSFYEYHATIMEPWDGPAALVFTDGHRQIGAMLDRNALRPCRFAITKDGLFILASEAGVLDLPPETVQRRGRLQPRRMLLVDFARQRVITDAECKGRVIHNKPYRHWIKKTGITLRDLPLPIKAMSTHAELSPHQLKKQQLLFGYDREDINDILQPMATNAQEPIASMGADTPLAVLSNRPQLLFSYLKQRFAQVTNPPIDPLREGLVMTLTGFSGKRLNPLEESAEHYAMLRLSNPVLFTEDLERLKASTNPAVKLATLSMTFKRPAKGESEGEALKRALEELFTNAEDALNEGATILLLSDSEVSEKLLPIPSLLAVSGMNHYLLRQQRRHECSIFVDTGEAREVMHIAQLLGFGASAVHPRLALNSVLALVRQGKLAKGMTEQKATLSYATAIQKGLLKTFSRMGISTLRSFVGGQSFEALGFSEQLTEQYFTGLASRIGGIDLESIVKDVVARHTAAFEPELPIDLPDAGRHRYRAKGERHLWTPTAVKALHKAVRENNYDSYKEYAKESNEQEERPVTLRSFLDFKKTTPISIDKVEPVESIMRRFIGAAMSFGSISPEAHEAIAVGMNRVGARSNCGEGGEDPSRNIVKQPDQDRRSRIRQVASGRFGVTAEYLVNGDEIQIKMAQGAKPGEGGQLPAHKVLPAIAKVRHTTPGVTLISPPPHHDIYSIEDLAQLIFDLKHINPSAKISVKLVAGSGVGTIASGVAKAGADTILISGHDGGTGASPRSAISHVGLPWEMGLAETQTGLMENGLRDKVTLQVDGQLRTGKDLAIAAMLGAEEFGIGTGLLVAIGCCMLRVCHLGTCAVGVAAQAPHLRERFQGDPEHIVRYLTFLAQDMREYMAMLGISTVNELIGRSDLLQQERSQTPRGGTLDLSGLLYKPEGHIDYSAHVAPGTKEFAANNKFVDSVVDSEMLQKLMTGINAGRPSQFSGVVRNTDRALGTRISSEITKKYGAEGLIPGTIDITIQGVAGQSAGAFLCRGVTLNIKGEANDYVGKGLSGGTIVVAPQVGITSFDDEQAAIGNVALYGATSGEIFISGTAGERFAVRNSGASAVVEGVGDHACEYMTGGVVVVLGKTGYNFAAGMSGGYAYVFDRSEVFLTRCNMDSVDLESVWQKEDIRLLHSLLTKHVRYTDSPLAKAILNDWSATLPLFLKVTPIEYQKALERMKQSENLQAESVAATEEVYTR